MDKLRLLVMLSLVILMLCSCKSRLSKKDYKWMPYTGHEVLIFNSNLGNRDTISLLSKDTIWSYPEAQSIFGFVGEMVTVFCKHSDSVIQDKSIQYIENNFCSVKENKNGHSVLEVDLNTKDATFYRLSLIKLDSLDKVKPVVLKTKYAQYNDVYIMDGEDYLGSFRKRYDFVTKIYWSKTKGLVRFDKQDSVYWELVN